MEIIFINVPDCWLSHDAIQLRDIIVLSYTLANYSGDINGGVSTSKHSHIKRKILFLPHVSRKKQGEFSMNNDEIWGPGKVRGRGLVPVSKRVHDLWIHLYKACPINHNLKNLHSTYLSKIVFDSLLIYFVYISPIYVVCDILSFVE